MLLDDIALLYIGLKSQHYHCHQTHHSAQGLAHHLLELLRLLRWWDCRIHDLPGDVIIPVDALVGERRTQAHTTLK